MRAKRLWRKRQALAIIAAGRLETPGCEALPKTLGEFRHARRKGAAAIDRQ
jgi:hypothetical protein